MQPKDDFISPYEAEHIVTHLKKIDIADYANSE
jgi:hypothetical protein